MSGKFHKKTSNILVSMIVGVMIIGLVFTFEFDRGGSDTLAKVGDYKINNREFNNEYNRQTEFYSQLFGGNSLTQAQIEQFKIRENALQNIIQRKLMLILGQEIGVKITSSQIKNRIKELPYFLTNEAFDINKYKQLLQANGLTPGQFESDIEHELMQQATYEIANNIHLSKGYVADLHQFKSQELSGDLFQVDTTQLVKYIPVSPTEIDKYLSVQINFDRVDNSFKERKSGLSKAAEVNASHILVKDEKLAKKLSSEVTKNNFSSLANKYSEDPGSKTKGGKLGWFSLGKMAPEFEKAAFELKSGQISQPVKTNFGYHIIMVEGKNPGEEALFKDHKESIAKEFIQKHKTDELKKLTDTIVSQATGYLEDNKKNQLRILAKEYKLSYQEDLHLNPIDGVTGSALLTSSNIQEIFKNGLQQNKTYNFKQPNKILLTRVGPIKEKSELSIEEDRTKLQTAFSRKLVQNALKKIEDKTNVKVYAQF